MFLKIGMTLASLSLDGKIPEEKDRLIMLERIEEKLSKLEMIIGYGMLLGPVALLSLRDLRTAETSSGVAGTMKKEFVFRFSSFNHSEKR